MGLLSKFSIFLLFFILFILFCFYLVINSKGQFNNMSKYSWMECQLNVVCQDMNMVQQVRQRMKVKLSIFIMPIISCVIYSQLFDSGWYCGGGGGGG